MSTDAAITTERVKATVYPIATFPSTSMTRERAQKLFSDAQKMDEYNLNLKNVTHLKNVRIGISTVSGLASAAAVAVAIAAFLSNPVVLGVLLCVGAALAGVSIGSGVSAYKKDKEANSIKEALGKLNEDTTESLLETHPEVYEYINLPEALRERVQAKKDELQQTKKAAETQLQRLMNLQTPETREEEMKKMLDEIVQLDTAYLGYVNREYDLECELSRLNTRHPGNLIEEATINVRKNGVNSRLRENKSLINKNREKRNALMSQLEEITGAILKSFEEIKKSEVTLDQQEFVEQQQDSMKYILAELRKFDEVQNLRKDPNTHLKSHLQRLTQNLKTDNLVDVLVLSQLQEICIQPREAMIKKLQTELKNESDADLKENLQEKLKAINIELVQKKNQQIIMSSVVQKVSEKLQSLFQEQQGQVSKQVRELEADLAKYERMLASKEAVRQTV